MAVLEKGPVKPTRMDGWMLPGPNVPFIRRFQAMLSHDSSTVGDWPTSWWRLLEILSLPPLQLQRLHPYGLHLPGAPVRGRRALGED